MRMHENYAITEIGTKDLDTKQEAQHPDSKEREQGDTEPWDH